jgi:uncharacterized protein (DUF169 family)
MNAIAQMGLDFKRALATDLSPIGFGFRSERPPGATGFKGKGGGCIMPLIFSAARGKTVAIDVDTTGWPCSAFYLGYADWIFPGIEMFLSDGPIGRECERFVASPQQAKQYLESIRIEPRSTGAAVFEPMELATTTLAPEVVIFFADPDRLSALVFLAQFSDPMDEHRVVTRFASACGAVTTLPLHFARKGELKAVWGMHDIAARTRLPKELMTFAMPFALAKQMHENLERSFLTTTSWATIAKRHQTE